MSTSVHEAVQSSHASVVAAGAARAEVDPSLHVFDDSKPVPVPVPVPVPAASSSPSHPLADPALPRSSSSSPLSV